MRGRGVPSDVQRGRQLLFPVSRRLHQRIRQRRPFVNKHQYNIYIYSVYKYLNIFIQFEVLLKT